MDPKLLAVKGDLIERYDLIEKINPAAHSYISLITRPLFREQTGNFSGKLTAGHDT